MVVDLDQLRRRTGDGRRGQGSREGLLQAASRRESTVARHYPHCQHTNTWYCPHCQHTNTWYCALSAIILTPLGTALSVPTNCPHYQHRLTTVPTYSQFTYIQKVIFPQWNSPTSDPSHCTHSQTSTRTESLRYTCPHCPRDPEAVHTLTPERVYRH